MKKLEYQDVNKESEEEREEGDDIGEEDYYDINEQIKYLRKRADISYNKLFGPRNEKGSEKEKEVLGDIYDNIERIKNMIEEDEINFKKINEKIDRMIVELKKVENRVYQNYVEIIDNGLEFQIEYCTKKKGKKKKHK